MSAAGERDSFWRRRVVAPILAQLQQGVTPPQVALTLALGAVLGIFPILGACTILCAIAGIALRLNQPLIQLVNYFVYPLQVLLLIPFYRAGEALFGADPVPIANVAALVERFGAGPWQFILDYGRVGLYGIVVWTMVAPPATALLYVVLKPAVAKLAGALRRPVPN